MNNDFYLIFKPKNKTWHWQGLRHYKSCGVVRQLVSSSNQSDIVRDLIALQGNFQQRILEQNNRMFAQHDEFVRSMLERMNN